MGINLIRELTGFEILDIFFLVISLTQIHVNYFLFSFRRHKCCYYGADVSQYPPRVSSELY